MVDPDSGAVVGAIDVTGPRYTPAEILTLLSLHRHGMSAEALAIALHGEAAIR